MATNVPSTIPLEALFDRSNALQGAVAAALSEANPRHGRRASLTLRFAALSIEHWGAQRLLLAQGLDLSAYALIRVQFEVTIRALWIIECASERWLDAFTAPQPSGKLGEPEMGPPVGEMLKAINERQPALASMLEGLKAASWAAMHSFVHGGARPLVHQIVGTSDYQVSAVLRNANGMALIATNVATIAVQSPALAGQVRRLQQEFSDCLPPLVPPPVGEP
ncbi:MAG: hypothetical protein ING39_07125 [Burkholderiales bacterium]|jgi:hypothetical protein|nr:hypothetical protein [Burkholderiales bacterium]